MFRHLRALPVIFALSLATASAAIVYEAPLGLTGDQEVPPRDTLGVGTGHAIYDPTTLTLSVSLTWQDLTAPAVASHIHCCSGPGANSTVAIDFVPVGFPVTTTGSFSHTFDLTAAASYGGGFLGGFGGDVDAARAAFLTGINANLAYFNIHTAIYPGGEIRGDIAVVPEPGSFVLLAAGAGALLLRRKLASR